MLDGGGRLGEWNFEANARGEGCQDGVGPVLTEAQSLVDTGKGDTMMRHVDFLYCRGTTAAAEAFVSYHGEQPRFYTPGLLASIDVPVLVVLGTEDDATKGLPARLQPMASRKEITLAVIDGADHFFRDLYAYDVVEAVQAFVAEAPGADP